MKNNKSKNSNARIRETKHGTQVVLKEKLGDKIWLCEAVTRAGCFITQVTEDDLV